VAGLTDHRLDSLYGAPDFGGETTMRARVIRELIDEIRQLRAGARAVLDTADVPDDLRARLRRHLIE
jgi:hypothetical protein